MGRFDGLFRWVGWGSGDASVGVDVSGLWGCHGLAGRTPGVRRATITAIGNTVNLANRIEQANKEFGTRLLVSDAARAEIGTPS